MFDEDIEDAIIEYVVDEVWDAIFDD